MVDRAGAQLYTIEGFAAAVIMLVTAWIVLGTTTVYTPGDTHISDMQLEQLGTDALAMMDTANSSTETSDLAGFINNTDADFTKGPKGFHSMFLSYCNSTTGGTLDRLQYNATVYYRDESDGLTKSYFFAKSRDITPGDHAVRVTRWVLIGNDGDDSQTPAGTRVLNDRNQTVLMEVLLWRG